RLNALELEAAVSQERTFLARELHDSIAQSLAFIQNLIDVVRLQRIECRVMRGFLGKKLVEDHFGWSNEFDLIV
ncbi:MAG: histidine kinase, partial [Sediminibacterium sp.]